MFIMQRQKDVTFFIEWRFCRRCMRMFCASTDPHVMFSVRGMIFHSHVNCPPLKDFLPKLLKGEKDA